MTRRVKQIVADLSKYPPEDLVVTSEVVSESLSYLLGTKSIDSKKPVSKAVEDFISEVRKRLYA